MRLQLLSTKNKIPKSPSSFYIYDQIKKTCALELNFKKALLSITLTIREPTVCPRSKCSITSGSGYTLQNGARRRHRCPERGYCGSHAATRTEELYDVANDHRRVHQVPAEAEDAREGRHGGVHQDSSQQLEEEYWQDRRQGTPLSICRDIRRLHLYIVVISVRVEWRICIVVTSFGIWWCIGNPLSSLITSYSSTSTAQP